MREILSFYTIIIHDFYRNINNLKIIGKQKFQKIVITIRWI